MGIKNLFSQTHGATRPVWLRDFAGETLAVDASVILHKGCCGCAREIAMNIPTDRYLKYFMKVVFNLEKFGVKPLIVFDGQLFPAKCAENKKREHQRSSSVKKAIALWNEKKYIDAQRLFSTSVSISEEMVQTVIKVFTKIDIDHGTAQLVEANRLDECFDIENWSMAKFRHLCVLAGCDYLPSIPGIGIIRAREFVTKIKDADIFKAVSRMGLYLGRSIEIPKEYVSNFKKVLSITLCLI
ncbi:exonuclease 1-like isoform X3 [Ptychodera flava]|uniref:exonuclease 1-like isoform X3 n=1 Tax=Ptychodera flava TaxID=63121 RepID=UPI003969BEBA